MLKSIPTNKSNPLKNRRKIAKTSNSKSFSSLMKEKTTRNLYFLNSNQAKQTENALPTTTQVRKTNSNLISVDGHFRYLHRVFLGTLEGFERFESEYLQQRQDCSVLHSSAFSSLISASSTSTYHPPGLRFFLFFFFFFGPKTS